MNKEPIGLYIFRFIVGLGLFIFMLMLYWSSVLVEERLGNINSDLVQVRQEIFSLRGSVEKVSAELSRLQAGVLASPSTSKNESDSIDSHFPNLLTEDPFYVSTLPQMLGPKFKPHGTLKDAVYIKPEHLHPFVNYVEAATWHSLCSGAVATLEIGKYETLATDLALRMELREDQKGHPEYWVFLRKDNFWQPLQQSFFGANFNLAPFFLRKHPVTAHDFKFFYDAVMNPHVSEGGALALRTLYNDLEELIVIDDYTFKVKWKTEEVEEADGTKKQKMKYLSKSLTGSLRPLASFVYQYFSDGKKIIENDADPDTYRTNPIWAQNFEHHWAKNIIPSCGPWMFNGMTDREIRFVRNPDFHNPLAALAESMEFKFKNSADAIWEEFKLGNLDYYDIPPNQLSELERFLASPAYQLQAEQGLAIKRLDYVSRVYAYVGWNEARPLFKSKKVRQALTLAVDRERILRQNLNGMGIQTTGTFFVYSPSYDNSLVPYPFDPQQALEILHEEGWYDSDGDGILDQVIEGKKVKFEFTLTYFVKNQTSKAISEYISTALKEIGIVCNTNGVEIADMSAIFEDKNFDAYYMGWALGVPPEDPRQIWYSTGAKEKGSSNAIGFANAEVDAIIDQLDYEHDPEKRIELYHRFDKIIYDEAPYIFLYTAKTAKVYREYLQNVFIPADRQDLIPGANMGEPIPSLYWIRKNQPKT